MKKLILIIIAIITLNNANAQWGQTSLKRGIYSFIVSFAEEDSSLFAGVNCGGIWRLTMSDSIGVEETILNYILSFYPNQAEDNNTVETNSYKDLLYDNTFLYDQSINIPLFNYKTSLDLQLVPKLVYNLFQSIYKK